jgi:hypothetical protein
MALASEIHERLVVRRVPSALVCERGDERAQMDIMIEVQARSSPHDLRQRPIRMQHNDAASTCRVRSVSQPRPRECAPLLSSTAADVQPRRMTAERIRALRSGSACVPQAAPPRPRLADAAAAGHGTGPLRGMAQGRCGHGTGPLRGMAQGRCGEVRLPV